MSDDVQPKSSLTAWERWELASFDHESTPAVADAARTPEPPPVPAISEEEIAAIRESARKEGHQAGYIDGHAEGLAAGQAETEKARQQYADQVATLIDTLERHIGELNQVVADELLALALEISRQVIRHTLTAKPEVILDVIREALAQLPMQHAAIHLHPEDASLVRSRAGDQISHAGHRIHEDPKLSRGDVVIEAGGSHLDATVANRWRRVLDTLGHGESWIDSPDP